MESSFMNIYEVSNYTGLRVSNLYSKVERKEIPHYRIGRLILFKREEIDNWMKGQRVDCIEVGRETRKIMKKVTEPNADVHTLVKRAIAEAKTIHYTPDHGKPDRIEGLRKEVSDGSL